MDHEADVNRSTEGASTSEPDGHSEGGVTGGTVQEAFSASGRDSS